MTKPPKYVPLEIHVYIHVDSAHRIEDVKRTLEEEFSNGFTSDGREAFFHPNHWTFGQTLRKSKIMGRIQTIAGVSHLINDPDLPSSKRLIIKRYNAKSQYNFEGE